MHQISAAPRTARGHRLWFLVVVALLAIGGLLYVRNGLPDMERNIKSWITAGIVLVTILLGLVWFLFLSRVFWKVRILVGLVLVLVGFESTKLLRVDGSINGTGLPRFTWRWKHASAAKLVTEVPPALPLAPSTDIPDVPQFFGPHRDGLVTGAGLARDWATTPPKELWRQPVGLGWSAFAVAEGRAFTQEQRGENETVVCYAVRTGRLLWVHTEPTKFEEWQGGNGPRATPTIDRGQVFAIGATGILQCLDAASGQLIWKRNVLAENKLANLTWGVAASPLVFDDTVVVTGGFPHDPAAPPSGPTVLAYHRVTGEPLWKSGTDKASYISPILTTLAGQKVVLSVNSSSLTAHDPATGRELLRFPWADDKWPKAAQPVVLPGDRVFLSAGYGIGCTLLKIAAAADGTLTATPLWKNNRMKTQFNSVGYRDGFFYGLDDGFLACVDAATGERKWKDGRFGSGQTLLVDDLVLIQSEQGPVVLASATPDAYHQLARLPALSSKTWNHPVLAGKYLLLRNDQEAVCYELPVNGTAK